MRRMSMKGKGPDQNKPEDGSIVVAVRVRPLSKKEVESGSRKCIEVVNDSIVAIKKSADNNGYLKSQMGSINEYGFDIAFDENASQMEVYEKTTKQHIKSVLMGFDVSVFAYGATGAGKTHTMFGNLRADEAAESAESGIVPNAVSDLFTSIKSMRCNPGEMYSVYVTFIEVYNEQVYDLLQQSSKPLSLREDQERGVVVVAGVTEQQTDSYDDVIELLHKGNQNRKTEATLANQVSSRSHAVLQIIVRHTEMMDCGRESLAESKLSLIDLAGSERASATNNRGARLQEGANINKSLLALANCINALAENSGNSGNGKKLNVKYRDSKLTHLLKSSLEGNCKLVMLANINPSHITYEDSHNTLKYANRAKNIKVNPTVRETTKQSTWLEREARLKLEVKHLRQQNHVYRVFLEDLIKRLEPELLESLNIDTSILMRNDSTDVEEIGNSDNIADDGVTEGDESSFQYSEISMDESTSTSTSSISTLTTSGDKNIKKKSSRKTTKRKFDDSDNVIMNSGIDFSDEVLPCLSSNSACGSLGPLDTVTVRARRGIHMPVCDDISMIDDISFVRDVLECTTDMPEELFQHNDQDLMVTNTVTNVTVEIQSTTDSCVQNLPNLTNDDDDSNETFQNCGYHDNDNDENVHKNAMDEMISNRSVSSCATVESTTTLSLSSSVTNRKKRESLLPTPTPRSSFSTSRVRRQSSYSLSSNVKHQQQHQSSIISGSNLPQLSNAAISSITRSNRSNRHSLLVLPSSSVIASIEEPKNQTISQTPNAVSAAPSSLTDSTESMSFDSKRRLAAASSLADSTEIASTDSKRRRTRSVSPPLKYASEKPILNSPTEAANVQDVSISEAEDTTCESLSQNLSSFDILSLSTSSTRTSTDSIPKSVMTRTMRRKSMAMVTAMLDAIPKNCSMHGMLDKENEPSNIDSSSHVNVIEKNLIAAKKSSVPNGKRGLQLQQQQHNVTSGIDL